MTSPMGTVTSDYNLNGWQTKRTLPNGAYTDYTYNSIGLLTSLDNRKSDNTQLSFWGGVAYDGVFNLASITSSNNAGGSTFNGVQNFTHDSLERLTQEQSTRFSGYTENNAWDAASNPLTFRNSANRTYNNANQRTSGALFVYDGNGNPTTYSGTTLTFDAENRMTGYGPSTANRYTYRADGLRASEGTGSGKTFFLYDGGTPVFRVDASGNLNMTYSYAPDGLAGWKSGSSERHFLFDWQGNLAHSLLDATQLKATYAYNAWGQRNAIYPLQQDSVSNDRFGYNARWGYFKDPTGLYYCQNRYYDPANGRWLNRDPIGFAGGMNLYGYCGGGPVGSADPLGLQKNTVAGDTSGDAGFGWLLPDYWGSQNGVTTEEMMEILSTSEGATFWGHGSRGKASYNDSQSFGASELREAGETRRKHGKKKMAFLAIDQCAVLSDPEFINAALEVAEEVRGFTGWTIDPTDGYKIGKKKTFKTPILGPFKPGPTATSKKGKPDKDKNIPDNKEKKRSSP